MGSNFESLFGRAATVGAEAPGRVNLMGEHTDYNGGLVLPMAIPQRTRVELAARDDGRVRVWSSARNRGGEPGSYALGAETPCRDWLRRWRGLEQSIKMRAAPAAFGVRQRQLPL